MSLRGVLTRRLAVLPAILMRGQVLLGGLVHLVAQQAPHHDEEHRDQQQAQHNEADRRPGAGQQSEQSQDRRCGGQQQDDEPAEAAGQQRTGGFRQPESAAAGVTPGNVLESNEPNRDEVRMKDMWQYQKDHMDLVSPLNRRKFTVLVVGTGLSGEHLRVPYVQAIALWLLVWVVRRLRARAALQRQPQQGGGQRRAGEFAHARSVRPGRERVSSACTPLAPSQIMVMRASRTNCDMPHSSM